jgi:hypothetical protein
MVEIAFARYPASEGKRGMPLRRDFTAIGGTRAPLRHIALPLGTPPDCTSTLSLRFLSRSYTYARPSLWIRTIARRCAPDFPSPVDASLCLEAARASPEGVARHELTIDLVLCAARTLGFCLALRVNTTRAAWARLPFKSRVLHLKAFRVYDH